MLVIRRHLQVIASLALLGTSTVGLAATAPATFAVTATVQATCLISASPLAFGVYTGVAIAINTTITVTCTNTTAYDVGLDPGTYAAATVTTRRMTGPAAAGLPYALFQDVPHAVNWGNSTGSWEHGTGNGAAQVITVYGQIAAGLFVTPGSYADTITATVNY